MTQIDAAQPSKIEVVLSIKNLTISLPKAMERPHAVNDVSFDLMDGEILCIIGESGSGKSVTASAVMGLLPSIIQVTAGSIWFQGVDLVSADDVTLQGLRGRAVSIIFQDPLSALNPLMTIGDQIIEVLDAHKVGTPESRRQKVKELLNEVGLPDPDLLQHQYPFRLSGGQRQRVMIAMALALDPDVLIADEPTTALDVTTQAQILELIRKIQRRKKMSVMFITHDFGVVAEIADRVIVMEKGHLVEQGTANQVLNAPIHPYTQRLITAVPRMTTRDRDAIADTPVVLEVEKLNKTYRAGGGFLSKARTVQAVNDVSLSIRKGRTLGVVGESGSGKSSLGRVLLKLLKSDSGRILFDGRDIAALTDEQFRPLRPYIQMIFQDPFASLNPRHTIGRILTVGPIAHGLPLHEAKAKALRLLKRVGLDEGAFDRFPHEFSGGQRQRVGIARALMFDPVLLVADEAVSALDVSIQAQILKLLAEIQQDTKVAMIFITHDLRVASQICDEVAVMYKGEIVECGPPSQIFRAPEHAYTQRLLAAIPGSDWEATG
ncbi:ABC transporter ATP-binding protein [Agrobacterium sp. SHOUNA12C]|uniref:Peptide ABC transporter n=2 Tax=Rhizobium rhizogenes TaxID=359 RepID=B9JL50_RHIR8|nr:ABC transporter ATP-binding protein [Rhizobium rhizogenes]ACM30642.1 peptide ABC transporter [Rhizobium rhizogenes K84]KAA6488820.1 ABC transporter ATP-binding protein [Agrobacterium sp. ICMP 7243]MCJ9723647.1 ABC transporter ATP-binding protein [Agrobacterium sp. BETTINA12B]MCJ9758023.1 ABC transporter ATP-binding protein [Agrobacterium sp. SHOUNA12C]OCJ15981.1 ABC transporter ATP-binding protein [Agrobacterium sp. B131/95]OCJ19287.1 ABC transporter ATP-binding protein [Agrobacterium sp. 